MLFKLSNLNSNLALTVGYLNPVLNNSAQKEKKRDSIDIELTFKISKKCRSKCDSFEGDKASIVKTLTTSFTNLVI